MSHLKDNRSPSAIVRGRYIFNGTVAGGLAAVALIKVAWSAGHAAEHEALTELVQQAWQKAPHALVFCLLSIASLLVYLSRKYLPAMKLPVYLVDTYCYKGPERLKVSRENYIKGSRMRKIWGEDALQFQEKLLNSSGLGDETYFPATIVSEPMNLTWAGALEESEMVMYGTISKLFEQTGYRPDQMDILINVCSCFSPTPSLASMIINHFKMRTDILSHNLAGMGCSAGVIAVDVAKHFLEAQPNKRVLIMCHENITINHYSGDNRSCLVSNCLFRMGGSACIMSNRADDKARAKYQLTHSVRSHIGADDDAFNAIRQLEDEQGRRGILLQRNVVSAAGQALKTNIAALAPNILPMAELARTVMDPKYMPDFRLAIDHFLIHTGGRAVIEEVEKKLSLDAKYVQPSKETLYRFGNTCCAAVFYVLTNVEARVGVKKGEKLWMLGFGTGFKCNSVVWKALKDIKFKHEAWDETKETAS